MGETLGVPGLGDAASALAQGADELRQGSAQLGQGKAEFEHGRVAARSGLARATASLADVWYQQLRFADARDLASNTLKELGDADPVSTARLLVARGEGSLGASGPSPEVTADLERALELARAASDEQVELSALRSLTTVKHESGLGQPEDWREIGELAARMGSWESAISAKVNGAMMLLDDHAGSVFAPAAEARELAAAHGMVEHAGWADYLEAEAAFISGDWDRAVAAGTRAMDLGEQNAYRRLNVRIVHVMVPIAAVRGDRAMLERAAAFYASIEGKFQFPDSPYARVVRAAQDLELATTGLAPYDLPEVEPRIVAFEDEPAGGSWSAALDRVFRAWIEAANLDGAARAVAAMEAALPRYQGLSSLGRGTFELLRGRLALARGARDDASIAARAALEQFRRSQAPWWIAKAIRLLERAGSADYQTVSEVFEIERRLGATEPIR